MHDFAIALNVHSSYEEDEDQADKETLNARFDALSLEYKLFNIHQVRSFSRYQDLSKADKDKNRQIFNSMLKLLKKFDGLRIYQYGISTWCYNTLEG